jgi:hypothetical protein
MFRRLLVLASLCICAGTLLAQDLSNLQIHGFVTQGFIYSSQNNLYTMNTSSGSGQWTDAAVSVSDAISDNFHVGVQLHVYQLGTLGGPNMQIDWATGDYRVNEKAKFVAGKVKTVWGLFNDSQDVDTVHLFVLLPESMYQIDNKNYTLSHYGGDYYGSIGLGKHRGSLAYRGYAGYRSLDLNGGYARSIGNTVGAETSGGGNVFGGDIRWRAPLKGLIVGGSLLVSGLNGVGPLGSFHIPYGSFPDAYAKFEKGKIMGASEYRRTNGQFLIHLNNVDPFGYPAPVIPFDNQSQFDDKAFYVMGSYRLTQKIQAGGYYSDFWNAAPTASSHVPANYSRDWVVCGRYDFNSYFYAKLEGHFISGTALDYYTEDNPTRKPDTRVLAAKVGFSF